MPDSESSIGVVITLSITSAVAPLNTVRTETTGGSIFGYSLTDNFSKAIAPSKMTVNVITVAKTGLFIEILDNINLN